MKILVSFFLLIAFCRQNSYSRVNVIPIDTLKINDQISGYYWDSGKNIGYYLLDSLINPTTPVLKNINFINENNYKVEFFIRLDEASSISTYNLINPDSIFAVSYHTNKLIHFNKNGFAQEWNIDVFSTPEEYVLAFQYKPAIIGNEFYFHISQGDGRQECFSKTTMGKIEITDNKVINPQRFLNFPIDYSNDSLFCPRNSISYIADTKYQFIVSFQMNDSLWVINGEKLTKYPAKSKYIDATKRLKIEHSNEEYQQYRAEIGYYGSVIYDKYRDLYYRTVYHNQQARNKDGTINKLWDRPWSIIVLDKDFNYIDELAFSAKEFRNFSVIPTPRGIILTKRIDNGFFEEEGTMPILYKLELE